MAKSSSASAARTIEDNTLSADGFPEHQASVESKLYRLQESSDSDVSKLDNSQEDEDSQPTDSFSFLRPPLSARKRSAWIWDHQRNPDRNATTYGAYNGRLTQECGQCTKIYAVGGGTGFIIKHLVLKHQITNSTPRQAIAKRVQEAINVAVARGSVMTNKRRRQATIIGDKEPAINQATLEWLVIRQVAKCSVPFYMVQTEEFRAMLTYLNPKVEEHLPGLSNTIKSWVLRTYKAEKVQIRKEIARAKTKIHISCDMQ